MRLELKKLTLDNFRGCKHGEYAFDGNVKIKGANGSGKSTLMSSVLWCMADVDSKLVKNPDVVPMGAEECNPTVEIEFELEGKKLTVCKQQKFKKKEIDGKATSSVANSYSINGVEKSYKAFTEDLSDRGIDMENLLYFCHPDAFLLDTSAKGREKIRTILFGLIDEMSDVEIAKTISVPELTKMLEDNGYKIEEAEAMAKSSLRKINEKYGKSNELLDSRISGMIESKSALDVKVLEEQKANYEAEIERIDTELSGDMTDKLQHISEIRMQREKMRNKAQQTLNEKKSELDRKLRETTLRKDDNRQAIAIQDNEIVRLETIITAEKEDLEKQRKLYKAEQDAVMDDDLSVCPVCKREFDAEKLSEIKAEFEENKAKRLKLIKSTGDKLKAEIKENEIELKAHQTTKAELEKTTEEYQKIVDDMRKKIDALPETADMSSNKVYQRLCEEIEEFDSNVKDQSHIKELKSQRNVNQQMLNQVIAELGSLEHNKEIDKQIAELRKEKREAEIQRAKHEKLLDEIKTFTQAKNDLLTSKINEKFSMVEWHLYEYQKNSEIKEVCEPYIDKKPMSRSANGSLVTLAKISICSDLQHNLGFICPIWCEDYSLFSSNTSSRIDCDSQLIGLVVTEDKDLVIENA